LVLARIEHWRMVRTCSIWILDCAFGQLGHDQPALHSSFFAQTDLHKFNRLSRHLNTQYATTSIQARGEEGRQVLDKRGQPYPPSSGVGKCGWDLWEVFGNSATSQNCVSGQRSFASRNKTKRCEKVMTCSGPSSLSLWVLLRSDVQVRSLPKRHLMQQRRPPPRPRPPPRLHPPPWAKLT
jgi:hypothetical protein